MFAFALPRESVPSVRPKVSSRYARLLFSRSNLLSVSAARSKRSYSSLGRRFLPAWRVARHKSFAWSPSAPVDTSNTFTGVISGLNHVYYEVGSAVKANVPLGYTNGETDVQVTMYSNGTLLNCFQLTDENCLAWVTQE